MGDITVSPPVTEAARHITAPHAWARDVWSQRRMRGQGTYGHITVPRAWVKSYYALLQEGHNMR
jgi:hypothetical protein